MKRVKVQAPRVNYLYKSKSQEEAKAQSEADPGGGGGNNNKICLRQFLLGNVPTPVRKKSCIPQLPCF